jgi:hypothetical protein
MKIKMKTAKRLTIVALLPGFTAIHAPAGDTGSVPSTETPAQQMLQGNYYFI